VNEQQLIADDLLGSYRRSLGWAPGGSPAVLHDKAHVLRLIAGPGVIG